MLMIILGVNGTKSCEFLHAMKEIMLSLCSSFWRWEIDLQGGLSISIRRVYFIIAFDIGKESTVIDSLCI